MCNSSSGSEVLYGVAYLLGLEVLSKIILISRLILLELHLHIDRVNLRYIFFNYVRSLKTEPMT